VAWDGWGDKRRTDGGGWGLTGTEGDRMGRTGDGLFPRQKLTGPEDLIHIRMFVDFQRMGEGMSSAISYISNIQKYMLY
jgi:hypothetical protein